jgi:vitamin B12/bleomycin/antimicrobial peptide transport system ATP-binding/permease protein
MASDLLLTREAAPAAASAFRPSRFGAARHVLGLFSCHWLSRDWKSAWASLIVLIVFQFGTAYILIAGNRWQQSFYDSVQQREAHRFVGLMLTFALILTAQVSLSLVEDFVDGILRLRWRTALTKRYLDRWLARGRYAEIERLRLIDNPDQRIAEDIALVTGPYGILMLGLGLLGMIVGSISFGVVLMETAEPIRIGSLSIPGSTLWYAVIYAVAGTLIMTWIGKPFVRSTRAQQHYEADFRAGMIHVRHNAGQIAFARSVASERATLDGAFAKLRRNYLRVIFSTMGLQFGQGIYQRIGSIVPLFLLVPRFFAGQISFGQVMGASDAFQGMVGRLSWIVSSYSQIGVQIACVQRLRAFDAVMDMERPRGIALSDAVDGGAVLRTDGLRIHRPSGAPLLTVGDWTVERGERWVVQGPSGCGKSTLLRAIIGLWPDGAGAITLDCGLVAMMVPQRLYLPRGTLKAAICFPDAETVHTDAAVLEILDHVGLGAHREHLHSDRIWQDELSPGEQQRIALARILLHRPEFLILDEATSALDTANAHRFHQDLLEKLPGVTLISVVHDDRLAPYHTHRLSVAEGCATAMAIEASA